LRVDEEGILGGFEHRPGKQMWIGEHAGKFLDAAGNTYLYTHDARLKELMDRVAHRLIATQLADGYLGTYTDDQRWTSWDVWVHKYDLIGLLKYHQITNDSAALEACRKVGDLLIATFGDAPGQRDIIKAGEHMGMAATSVLEPMVYLYRATGEKKYLDFCYYITRAYDHEGGPRVISNLTETGRVYGTANNKAYEMLSNLVGLVELYRTTGDEKFLVPAKKAWDDVVKNRLYLSGTTSTREHFMDDGLLPAEPEDKIGEGCVTVTWLQLSWQLLRLSGDVKYAEEIERSVFNQLLAAQNPENGNISYYTPLNGRRNQGKKINCCLSSEPRGISMVPQFTWGTQADAIEVNLYTPGEVKLKVNDNDVAVKCETDFPTSGNVSYVLSPSRAQKFSLLLRVPAWCTSYSAKVANEEFTGTPGTWLTITRTWSAGDTVKIAMDLPVKLHEGGKSYPNSLAVTRGPQLLALDKLTNPDIEYLNEAFMTDLAHFELRPDHKASNAWLIKGKIGPNARDLVLVPYASATECRAWLAKP